MDQDQISYEFRVHGDPCLATDVRRVHRDQGKTPSPSPLTLPASFPALPFLCLINIPCFLSHPHLHPDLTTPRVRLPCQCITYLLRALPRLPSLPLLHVNHHPSCHPQHASRRQQRNAHLGAQHLLGHVLTMWRLGPKKKRRRYMGVHSCPYVLVF
jgi:hypothetical protein